ncbi:hypothetical protein DBT_0012 [Dissulfuribacter thermophilus]|uniref:Uncharacterized protein n=1 Tax=Dissulfuribacter thermophilus TaxID=1156395 RepID=A0A1B9F8Q6_9BACT|nr:hypothetical protein DBT_0012 [Dissulfuribacter thermophilus]
MLNFELKEENFAPLTFYNVFALRHLAFVHAGLASSFYLLPVILGKLAQRVFSREKFDSSGLAILKP